MRIKTGICHKFAFILPFLGVLGGLCSPASLLAENFFSFGGGVLYPQNVTNVTATENGNYPNAPIPALYFPGTRDSDLQLDNAGAVDVKVGHFLEDHPWLGCEAEYLHANPNFPEQIVALTNPAFVPLAGISTIHQEQLPASISMNLLHFDFLARYPGETFQPYVGVGLGVIFTKVSGEGRSGIILERPGSGEDAPPFAGSSADLLFNLECGLRVNLTDTLYAYGEWQFNTADLHISNFRSQTNISCNSSTNSMLFGLGVRFSRLSDLNPWTPKQDQLADPGTSAGF